MCDGYAKCFIPVYICINFCIYSSLSSRRLCRLCRPSRLRPSQQRLSLAMSIRTILASLDVRLSRSPRTRIRLRLPDLSQQRIPAIKPGTTEIQRLDEKDGKDHEGEDPLEGDDLDEELFDRQSCPFSSVMNIISPGYITRIWGLKERRRQTQTQPSKTIRQEIITGGDDETGTNDDYDPNKDIAQNPNRQGIGISGDGHRKSHVPKQPQKRPGIRARHDRQMHEDG